jgi:Ca-activated chloride channel family protein
MKRALGLVLVFTLVVASALVLSRARTRPPDSRIGVARSAGERDTGHRGARPPAADASRPPSDEGRRPQPSPSLAPAPLPPAPSAANRQGPHEDASRLTAALEAPTGIVGVSGGVAGGVVGGIVGGMPSAPASVLAGRKAAQAQPEAKRERRPDTGTSAELHTEAYDRIVDNPFLAASGNPLSTFSIDVDTASYANVRRFLAAGQMPPKDAVRIEELLNYFRYDYPEPRFDEPFSVTTELAPCPWRPEHRLVLVGLRGRSLDEGSLPPRRLTFLLDVSGSMMPADKLPLLKRAMAMLADTLREQDRVAIVVYAGSSGLVLPPTSGAARGEIRGAIAGLEAGGSTAGGAGIELAYDIAARMYEPGAINRVLLATDGDFNVGVTSIGELSRLIEEKRKTGVFLSVLGFGQGNLKDATMEMLADRGNGNYSYIDGEAEARKVLVSEAGSTLVTIAKDVKIQVEWNPRQVAGYRLIGYENRLLRAEDFDDDAKDAGEIGAGHTVTALYEVVPAGLPLPLERPAIALKYQEAPRSSAAAAADELLTVKLRYKDPEGSASRLLSRAVSARVAAGRGSERVRFAASVAAFGMLLRESEHRGQADWPMVIELAQGARGRDETGYRAEFVTLAQSAARLSTPRQAVGQVSR